MASRRYASLCEEVWIAVMSPAANRLRPCLQQVAHACGLPYLAGGSHRMGIGIADRMRGTRGLLIVDEAQFLGHLQMEALRGLHDETGCGRVLLGNDRFGRRIAYTPKFAALASRVGERLHLPGATARDVQAMLDAWGIKGRKAREAGRRLAAPPGGLRRLARALKRGTLASGKGATARHPRDHRSLSGGAA